MIRPVEPVGIKLENRCPGCAAREGELHKDWCSHRIAFKTNTPRADEEVYSCCGGRKGGKHFMSCEHYDGHF